MTDSVKTQATQLLDRGGQFAAFEQPGLFVDQVRRASRSMR